jgi:membrane protein YdbS with pleckstrin-like domain
MTQRSMGPIVFRSKVDAWLGAVLIGAALASVGSAAAVAMVREPLHAVIVVPIVLLGAVLPLWLLRTTDYTLNAAELLVRCGPFKWRIPLGDIRTVTATRNPLSSPALSLDRLRIDYGPLKSIMISPADQERFLAELERRRRSG